MNVLITNNTLARRAGSEIYVRDAAIELHKRGHTPVAYSTDLGEVALELQAANIPVVDDLSKLQLTPDLIHGQQHMELMTALLHFSETPAVQFIHNATSWYEKPIHHPRVLRYVAVDHACRDLLLAHGIPERRIRVLLNFVDMRRFRPRRQPLPPQPKRALLFSNYASEETQLPAVRDACARARIKLDVVGSQTGTATTHPEEILDQYDLVFAKAKSALEAMAVGAAVVLCDYAGSGPMVTTANFAELRPMNFGRRTLSGPLEPGAIVEQIKRYDAEESFRVSQLVRASAGHEPVIDELTCIYEEVIEEFKGSGGVEKLDENRAAAAYLRQLKIDFAANADAASRMRKRLESVPVVGRIGVRLARALTRKVGTKLGKVN
jgi:glycosyltransferase involved in cell wall biosynthesis